MVEHLARSLMHARGMRRRGGAVLRQPARHRRVTPDAASAAHAVTRWLPHCSVFPSAVALHEGFVRHAVASTCNVVGLRLEAGRALLTADCRAERRKRAAAAGALQNLAALRAGSRAILDSGASHATFAALPACPRCHTRIAPPLCVSSVVIFAPLLTVGRHAVKQVSRKLHTQDRRAMPADTALRALCLGATISSSLGALAILEALQAVLAHFPDARQAVYNAGADYVIEATTSIFKHRPLIYTAAVELANKLDLERVDLRHGTMYG